jgi:hypothetical protein
MIYTATGETNVRKLAKICAALQAGIKAARQYEKLTGEYICDDYMQEQLCNYSHDLRNAKRKKGRAGNGTRS